MHRQAERLTPAPQCTSVAAPSNGAQHRDESAHVSTELIYLSTDRCSAELRECSAEEALRRVHQLQYLWHTVSSPLADQINNLLTLSGNATLLNEIVGGAKVGCDVSHIDVRHLDPHMLVAVWRLEILWVVVDGDNPVSTIFTCIEGCHAINMPGMITYSCCAASTANLCSHNCLACWQMQDICGMCALDSRGLLTGEY